MRSAQDISKQIRAQLKIIDPDMSAEPLTPERKIIDSVAQVISDVEADIYTFDYQFDIDSKIGTELDKFIALFGFARQAGVRATGLVTFYLSTDATADIVIPAGTSVYTNESSVGAEIEFVTVLPVTIYQGTKSISAPIQCSNFGTIGNVPVNSIGKYVGTNVTEISYVNNEIPSAGGKDPETDAQLRTRFKNTVLRNVAGTKDQYLAIALNSQYTNKAKIIGAIDTFIEYMQIPNARTFNNIIPAASANFSNLNGWIFDSYTTSGTVVSGALPLIASGTNPSNQVGLYRDIASAQENQVYTAKASFQNAAGNPQATHAFLKVDYYDIANVFLESFQTPNTALTTNTWNELDLTSKAPNGTDYARFNIFFTTSTPTAVGDVITADTSVGSIKAPEFYRNQRITSQIPYSKHTYDFDYYLTDKVLDSTTTPTFFKPDLDFKIDINAVTNTIDGTVKPGVIILSDREDGKLDPTQIVVFQHSYNSINSRNTPTSLTENGAPNYIDIYVDGEQILTASESIATASVANLTNTISGSEFFVKNWRYSESRKIIPAGYYVQDLIWQPVAYLPNELFIGGITYKINQDYYLIEDASNNRGSKRARNGILWTPQARATLTSALAGRLNSSQIATFQTLASQAPAGTIDSRDLMVAYAAFLLENTLPALNLDFFTVDQLVSIMFDQNYDVDLPGSFSIDYGFNNLIISLNQLMDEYKQVNTDILVHAANKRYFVVNLAVMFSPGFNQNGVKTAIDNALANYFSGLDFGTTIQFSDIEQLVHNINGVDNVKIATPADGSDYGLREVSPNNIYTLRHYRSDFALKDIDSAVFVESNIISKAQNTWR